MQLAIIGDYDPNKPTHRATNEALNHSAGLLGLPLTTNWIYTDTILDHFGTISEGYDGFLIAPGGPYRNIPAALDIIRFARLHHKPVLGTCGGFQYMLLEFAKNVLGIADAAHAEVDPDAPNLVIAPLTCVLKGAPLEISLLNRQSRVYRLYEAEKIQETYFCSFGLNPIYHERLREAGFSIVGTDGTHEARILELKAHPFFVASLFVPQAGSTAERPHVLINGFLQSIAKKIVP
jgi:CTP synthase (UTP-ammonia lyase)